MPAPIICMFSVFHFLIISFMTMKVKITENMPDFGIKKRCRKRQRLKHLKSEGVDCVFDLFCNVLRNDLL